MLDNLDYSGPTLVSYQLTIPGTVPVNIARCWIPYSLICCGLRCSQLIATLPCSVPSDNLPSIVRSGRLDADRKPKSIGAQEVILTGASFIPHFRSIFINIEMILRGLIKRLLCASWSNNSILSNGFLVPDGQQSAAIQRNCYLTCQNNYRQRN